MSQYDLTFFYGGGRRRIKVYKNKEVTVGGNSVQVLSPGTKICVCKRIYTGDYVCVVPKNSHSPIWNLIEYCQFTEGRLKTIEVLKFNAPARN